MANGSFLVSQASRMRIRPMDRQPCRGFYGYLTAVVDPVAGPGHRFRGTCRKRRVAVESWLHGLSLANATKAKVRNVMHGIFAHACRHKWLHTNPISLVRQSAKREKMPDVLDAEELKKLLAELQNPARALVFLTAATGLRVSEALGLKWSDVDFGTLEPRRSSSAWWRNEDGSITKTSSNAWRVGYFTHCMERADCPYRKCYPVRMPFKSVTFKKMKLRAVLTSRSECYRVTLG